MGDITTAMVTQFSANVMHLAQQRDSRLFKYTVSEYQNAEKKGYDRVGTRTARRKEGRHSKVVYSDTDQTKRWVAMDDYYDATLTDNEDKLRLIMDPDNEYAMAIAGSLGRQLDDLIIVAALGSALTGKDGSGTQALTTAQKIVCFDGSTTTGVGLNVKTLRAVKKKFTQNEVMQRLMGKKIIFVCAAQQIDDLLGNTEVTSSDFNSVKALVDGDVDTYMGFKFEQTELLYFNEAAVTYNILTGVYGSGTGTIAAAAGRRCFAFIPNSAIRGGHGDLVKGRVTPNMAEYHYATQVYGSLQAGFVRMEEVQLMEVVCYEP